MKEVAVVYALPEQQILVDLSVADNATIEDVLVEACARRALAGVDWCSHKVGIFGRVCEVSTPVQNGDRIEIYRPLIMDAKTARRHRAGLQASS